MRTRFLPAAGIVVMLCTVARCLGGGDAAAEMKNLEGSWRVVGGERYGKTSSRFDGSDLHIKNGTLSLEREGKVLYRGTIKLHPQQAPKAMDVKLTEGDGKGETSLGIYKLSGDRLELCFDDPGVEQRPRQFTTREGTELMLVVVQRR
jgi:uncharacterized protein (TIGR03067 family)